MTQEERNRNFIRFMGLSGAVILLCAFVGTLTGLIDLRYTSTVDVAPWLNVLLKFVLYAINILFVSLMVLGRLNRKFMFCLFVYFSIYALTSVFLTEQLFFITSMIYPLILVIFAGLIIYRIKLKTILIRYAILALLTALIQQITAIIKFDIFGLVYYDNVVCAMLYSIDLLLYYLLCLEVKRRGNLVMELAIFSETKVDNVDDAFRKEVLKLTKKQRLIYFTLMYGYQLLQLLVVLSIGAINNMFIELAVMLPMFWIGRKIMGKSYHSNKLWVCSLGAFVGFYILTKVALPFEISLFSVVACSALFVWVLHVIGIKTDRLAELETRYETDFTKYGLSPMMARIAYDKYVAGLENPEIKEKYNYDESAYKKCITRINNKLKEHNVYDIYVKK